MTRCLRNLALATTALLPLGIGFAVAGPEGGVVVGGGATISGQGTANVTINQTTSRTIINWHTFNIGTGEKTQFIQPDASSIALNRVTGGLGPSQILGTLSANSRVFLINRDGILFGPNAKVDTAGFLATTSDITNENFMAGRHHFNIPGRPDASIVNHGTITAHSAGFAALVAPGVRNTGTITATLGTIGLASGNSFTLDLYGDKLITLAVGDKIASTVHDVQTGKPLSSLVENTGRLKANGGRVELTAAEARHVVDSVINNRGVIEANRIGKHGGTIVLSAATAGTKSAGAPKQTVRVSGTLSAAAKKKNGRNGYTDNDESQGGRVVITGEDIQVAGARVDVSGPAGGGTVLIGGDWGGGNPRSGLVNNPRARLENEAIPTASTVTIDSATVIDASATHNGTGGKVIVWSDEATSFAGLITATGGSSGGGGGFVEVSGKQKLDFTGLADLRAPMGTVGTLLLDPANLHINTTGTPPQNDPSSSAMKVSTIEQNLQTANVVVSTQPGSGSGNGDIFVDASINWNTPFSLTLSSFHDVVLSAPVTIKTSGGGDLILRADNTGTGAGVGSRRGTVIFQATSGPQIIASNGGDVSIYYNPSSFAIPTSFTNNVSLSSGSTLTAYMLVSSATDLQNISTNLGGVYALGRDFSAVGFDGFAPNTQFTGVLDGNGGLGQNHAISSLSTTLFPFIGTGGIVRNLGLTKVAINASGPGMIGALAGVNNGTIRHVSVDGTVNGGQNSGVIAGGLVGQNGGGGLITDQSSSAVNVTVGNGNSGPGGFNSAGSLAGVNLGTINQTSASGNVTGGTFSFVGGLVGNNSNSVMSSSATGTVTGLGSAGGLVGFNGANATVSGSQASGNVSTSGNGFAGGLVGQNEGMVELSSFNVGTVSGTGSTSQFVSIGGLVGTNHGTVRDSSVGASATVNGTFANAGGLVGSNSGQITGTNPGQVSANATVTVSGAHSSGGGLVGSNDVGGTIHNANATGLVRRDPNAASDVLTKLGGLAGQNAGNIDHSTASAVVQGGFGSAGGLVGQNDGAVTTSSASGAVSGTGFANGFAALGGLVGMNNAAGQISSSSATGTVTIGGFGAAGGLVGQNSGALADLSTSNAVNSTGLFTSIGGLVGMNNPGATITNSQAFGNVTSSANGTALNEFTSAGGLVGQNFGTIKGTSTPAQGQTCVAGQSCAMGAVSVGAVGTGGGLVGFNGGTIINSFALGAVTGAAGLPKNADHELNTNLGGLAGTNQGTITDSFAQGSVGTAGVAFLDAGGLVGDNSGTILRSFALGNVVVGDNGSAGGLVGNNSRFEDCPQCTIGDGHSNDAKVADSRASGNVTAGALSLAGGIAGSGNGTFTNVQTTATQTVSAGHDSIIGGMVGALGVDGGAITNSQVRGQVTGLGANSIVGGLVGVSGGTITGATASGAVTAASHSHVGGLVGINFGSISQQSAATGSVTGTGTHNVLGGLVGVNAGTVDHSSAAGAVTGGDTSIVGGLVGANVVLLNVPPQFTLPGSSFPNGTIVASSATGAVSGGNGSHVGGLIGHNGGSIAGLSAGNTVSGGVDSIVGGLVGVNGGPPLLPSLPAIVVGCDAALCNVLQNASVSTAPGSIASSHANGTVSGGDDSIVGGLVGKNPGSIANSQATGAITGSEGSVLGGLVGENHGAISASSASGNVTATGPATVVGGLVGSNEDTGTVATSSASGIVTANFLASIAGGLVGNNEGTITASSASGKVAATVGDQQLTFLGGLVGLNSGTISQSTATGQVTGGSFSVVGGLVGANAGAITQSSASGAVSGGEGADVGGLVGWNIDGTVAQSSASGAVAGGLNSSVGGLVGLNFAAITNSSATGAVSGGDGSLLGGLAGANLGGTISQSSASGAVNGGDGSSAGGLVGINGLGVIEQSLATGAVTGGQASQVGGLVGGTFGGTISQSSARGTVTGGDDSQVGGLVGTNLFGLVERSFATGAVTGGDNSQVGGLVAINAGTITQSFATGAVTGGDSSQVGGLVAVNQGIPGFAPAADVFASGVITQSYSTGSVTGGANSTVAGLVAENNGTIDQTWTSGRVTAGPGSTTGGLIAVNNADPGAVTNSYWDRQATGQTTSAGGTALTTAQLSSGLPAGFDPLVWNITPGQSYPFLLGQPVNTIPGPGDIPPPEPQPQPQPQPLPQPVVPPPDQLPPVANLQIFGVTQVDPQPVIPPPVVTPPTQTAQTTSTGQSRQSRTGNQQGGQQGGPRRPDGRPSNVPPINETRFIDNHVVVQIGAGVSQALFDRAVRRLGLTVISSQPLGLLGTRLFHFQIDSGRSVRDVIIELEKNRFIDEAAPNYTFELAQDAGAPADAGQGDAAQYMISKLRLADAHRLATGENVRVAVIDSEIDAKHPDLEGAIAARYDAVGPADKPHPHGTGMAGAIASQRKLKGVAPGARILAIRAFGGGASGAQGTTVQIVQGLDWAINEGAKIVNMSFAGPKDPTLQKAFKAATDRGVVLIAAAGNAGPKSPPLYPGADANVIAVSATDANDKVYANANRGKYIAVAAPGVDILVPAPDGNYEFTTGTSVAAAHVSGVAALMLQRDPKLDPAAIREILTSTANRLGAKGRTDELGYGIVDPYSALLAVSAKSASAPASRAPTAPN